MSDIYIFFSDLLHLVRQSLVIYYLWQLWSTVAEQGGWYTDYSLQSLKYLLLQK